MQSSICVANHRDISIDITRIIAFLSVPAVHFFLNSGYYTIPVIGTKMYIMTIARTFFMICVPLFMLLSGYLMISYDIKIEKGSILRHYSKLSNVIVTYLLATLMILAYRIFYAQESLSIKDCLLNFLGYEQYSWYVNMYIGCYLLIPLLNTLWKAIGTKQGHLITVIIFGTLTIIPSIFNVYDFNTPGAITSPWLSDTYNKIIPNWWNSIYPLTYYFIGAYLRTHVNIKNLKTWKILLLLISSVTVFGIYNIWRSYGINFVRGTWCSWGSLQNTVNSTLVFLLINSIKFPNCNVFILKSAKLISNLTFGAYLLSWIPDKIYYAKLAELIPSKQQRFYYSPIIVAKVIVFSLVGSMIIHLIKKLFSKIYNYIKYKSSKNIRDYST